MSEKRFVKVTPFTVNDTWDNHRPMECASSLDADVVCYYLNEQQNIISRLESDLQKIPPKIRELWIGEE